MFETQQQVINREIDYNKFQGIFIDDDPIWQNTGLPIDPSDVVVEKTWAWLTVRKKPR